ncbi:MAG: putative manganese-dependent inorganic diphosphatase, partial [Clostridia bacterium]
DIAAYDMRSIDSPTADSIPMCNLLSALEGRILGEDGDTCDISVSGDVTIALPQERTQLQGLGPGRILLCGSQPELMKKAAACGVKTMIVCQAEVAEDVLEALGGVCVISTPCDVYRAARMIYQAVPIDRVCETSGLVSFHLDDYIDDVRELMLESRFRCYPILDEHDQVVGTLSRFHLIRPRRKRVVLVDHNEKSQSVPGLEQAEVLEIVDHHRLADVQTGAPIFFRNEPVGSTATIIATMFQERGLMPTAKLAGLICAAIVSDTVLFKSPTCTARDHKMAERMARIAGISIEQLGHDIFAASSNEDKPAEALFLSDFKEFLIAGHSLGIGQINCLDSARVLKRKEELLAFMQKRKAERHADMELFMITDVLRVGTELVIMGAEDIIQQAFNVEVKDHHVFLPGVVSRKKQVVPMLSLLWG